MNISYELTNLSGLQEKLGAASNSFVHDVMLNGMTRGILETRGKLFRRLSGHVVDKGFWGKGSPEGPEIGVRSGNTRQMLSPGFVARVDNTVSASVGHPSQHVADLEIGKLIKPTNGKYLRIPTVYAQDPSGNDRNAGRSMLDVPGTKILRTKKGNLFIFAVPEASLQALDGGFQLPGTTKGVLLKAKGKLIPLYMLVESVKLPEKRIFAITFGEMAPRMDELLYGTSEAWLHQRLS